MLRLSPTFLELCCHRFLDSIPEAYEGIEAEMMQLATLIQRLKNTQVQTSALEI